jgi:hypothetical protein
LKHPDRVIRAKHRHRRPEPDSSRARGDRAEHHVGRRHREVLGVVLADAEEVDADLVGEHALLDDIPNRLGMRVRPIVLVVRPIAKRVESKHERELCRAASVVGLSHSL